VACRSGCPTGGHLTWGECARAANLQTVVGAGHDAVVAWDSELDLYAKARAEGIQPASTKRRDIEAAFEITRKTKQPFDASGGVGIA
jgi:hypothetical protein